MFLDESSCGLGSWRTQIYTSCAVEYSQDTYKPLQAAIARFLRKRVSAGVGSLRVVRRWTWEESGMISCHNPKVLAIRTWDSSTSVPQDLDESSHLLVTGSTALSAGRSVGRGLFNRWMCRVPRWRNPELRNHGLESRTKEPRLINPTRNHVYKAYKPYVYKAI